MPGPLNEKSLVKENCSTDSPNKSDKAIESPITAAIIRYPPRMYSGLSFQKLKIFRLKSFLRASLFEVNTKIIASVDGEISPRKRPRKLVIPSLKKMAKIQKAQVAAKTAR